MNWGGPPKGGDKAGPPRPATDGEPKKGQNLAAPPSCPRCDVTKAQVGRGAEFP